MPRALITGPTSGIGRAFAEALASEGYDLVLVSRDEQRLAAVADEVMTSYGVKATVLRADLADLGDTRTVEALLTSEPVDFLVNNAGFALGQPFHDSDIDTEQASLDVLVRATMRLTHAAIGPMLAAGAGDIVNVSSVAGFLPRGTYGAHKAWVTSFSSWAQVRYRGAGVRVMALCPGFVCTEFHQRIGASTDGIPDWMWLESGAVVRAALSDLRSGKSVSVPSLRYKALVGLARAAPRPLVERLARRGR